MKFPRILGAGVSAKLAAHLKRGGLAAYPTESSYGLGCLPRHTRALAKLVRLKKRPQHKGMIVIGSSAAQLAPLLRPSENLAALPAGEKPTTFLLPCRRNTPPQLRGKGRHKLAVRVPAHEGARALCGILGSPLVSTSCNRAGKRPCRTEREARRQFGRNVWVIGGRTGGLKTPSRIIDAETGEQLR